MLGSNFFVPLKSRFVIARPGLQMKECSNIISFVSWFDKILERIELCLILKKAPATFTYAPKFVLAKHRWNQSPNYKNWSFAKWVAGTLSLEKLLFGWFKAQDVGLDCSKPQKVSASRSLCHSKTKPLYQAPESWKNEAKKSCLPSGVQGHGFEPQKRRHFLSSSALKLIVFMRRLGSLLDCNRF